MKTVSVEFIPDEQYGYQYPTLRCPTCGKTRTMDCNDTDAALGLVDWLEEHQHEDEDAKPS